MYIIVIVIVICISEQRNSLSIVMQDWSLCSTASTAAVDGIYKMNANGEREKEREMPMVNARLARISSPDDSAKPLQTIA